MWGMFASRYTGIIMRGITAGKKTLGFEGWEGRLIINYIFSFAEDIKH